MQTPAATANYKDTWAGDVRVTLTPSRSTRGGKRVVIYQWKADSGYVNAGGFIPKQNAATMIAMASRHPMFSNVVAL